MLVTSHIGDNAQLIKAVSDFYIKDGQKVADVTYGKGAFWRECDLSRFKLYASDLVRPRAKCLPAMSEEFKRLDFTDLGYDDNTFHHLALDPPYRHNPGKPILDVSYGNSKTTKGMYHRDIMELYGRGMAEAWRVLKQNGMLWVKCQDEIESNYQRASHIEIWEIAMSIGFFYKDLFVLTSTSKPVLQHKRQLHARKNHSYLWIFQKPTPRRHLAQTRKVRSTPPRNWSYLT